MVSFGTRNAIRQSATKSASSLIPLPSDVKDGGPLMRRFTACSVSPSSSSWAQTLGLPVAGAWVPVLSLEIRTSSSQATSPTYQLVWLHLHWPSYSDLHNTSSSCWCQRHTSLARSHSSYKHFNSLWSPQSLHHWHVVPTTCGVTPAPALRPCAHTCTQNRALARERERNLTSRHHLLHWPGTGHGQTRTNQHTTCTWLALF